MFENMEIRGEGGNSGYFYSGSSNRTIKYLRNTLEILKIHRVGSFR